MAAGVRLIVFGDSYVRDPAGRPSWADLLGERLGWPTLNVAVPGSGSGTLLQQLDWLRQLVKAGEVQLDRGAWALVHTGGNDLMRSSAAELGLLLRTAVGSAICPAAQGGARTLCDGIADRVGSLVEGLEGLGVRNVIVMGMPLTAAVPAVSSMVRAISGAECRSLGGLVLRRLNAFHLERLRALLRELPTGGGRALCLDEAASIDASLRRLVWRGDDADAYWRDGMHLSPRGHAALAEELVAVVQRALGHAVDDASLATAAVAAPSRWIPSCVSRWLALALCCTPEGPTWTALVQAPES